MVKSIVASYESQEKNGHNFRFFINLRRKLSSENFCRKRHNWARGPFSAWPAAIRFVATRLRRGSGPPRRSPGPRRSRAGRRSQSCDAWRECKLTTRLPDTYPAVPRENGLKERPLVGFISSVRTLLILPGLGIEVSRYRQRFLRSRGTEIVFPGRGDQLPQVFRLAKLSL